MHSTTNAKGGSSSLPTTRAPVVPKAAAPSANPRTTGKGANKSLRELYDDGCLDARVHPNSVMRAMLPEKVGMSIGDVLDLSRNYIGDRGMAPVLLVVQKSPGLKTLVLCENGLRNNAIKMLCAVAALHPSLQHIDVSDNYISEGAAFALMHLVEENPRLQSIEMTNTKIAAEHRIRIKDRLAQNALDHV